MKKFILITLMLLSPLFAQKMVVATQSCEAYNNMKHTNNTGKQSLTIGDSYKVLDDKKGQYYITISGISVPNRWVDKNCFEASTATKTPPTQKAKTPPTEKAKTTHSTKPKYSLLALSWQNAFCQTHQRKAECQRARGAYTDTRFSLHGLWPQPRENLYCDVSSKQKQFDKRGQWYQLPKLELTATTRKELLRIMPASTSNLQKHEWIKHGTCSGMNPQEYYAHAIELTKQLNNSKVGQFFSQNIGKKVTLQQVRFKMNESFGQGSGKRAELRCRNGLITEIWLHLGNQGESLQALLQGGKEVNSRCREGKIDRVGF